MTAYLIVSVEVHESGWMADYQANVPPIVSRHGGVRLAEADQIKCYEGEGRTPDTIFVATFPSMRDIDAFITDPAYQPYRDARLSATSSNAFAFSAKG